MTKIFIDAGHGGSDSGAVGNGLREKDLTLTISKKIKKYLDDNYNGHTVKLSRTTDRTLSLKQRTDMANQWGANYLISIHINAGGGTGYEDYIYSGNVNVQTNSLRNIIHAEVIKQVSDWRNRGKKKANFHMLRESRMPAMLTENGFIDTKADADKLKSAAFINKIVKGHAEGLANAFKLKPIPSKASSKLYKVQIGAFKSKPNADQLALKARSGGFDQFIVRQDGLFKVQIGAYASKENADAQVAKAKKAGFDTYIVHE